MSDETVEPWTWDGPDDLDQLLAEVRVDPVAQAAYEDAQQRDQLLRNMVDTRTRLAIKQVRVAEAMGTTQSAVSELETGRVDPRLSTLQRYARAVGQELQVTVTPNHKEPARSATIAGAELVARSKRVSSNESVPHDLTARVQSFFEATRLQPVLNAQHKMLTKVVNRLQPGDVQAKIGALMPDPTALLRTELTTLLRLTQTEAAITQARRAQAASAEINQELAQNAANCNERADLLAEQIARLGGVPDVLGGALGRVSAFAKLQLDQTQSFPEALLGDLARERQLLDRTRFAKALAQAASEDDVLDILDRLEVAHTATVDWLHLRLAEVAVGGPVALRPTPVQAALSSAQAVAGIPAVQANKLVNRAIALANRLRGRAVESTKSTVDRTVESTKSTLDRGTELASAGASVVTAGRDAMLNRGETVAREQGAASLADSVHAVREDLGIVLVGLGDHGPHPQ